MKIFPVLPRVLWTLLLATAVPAAQAAGNAPASAPDLASSQLYADLAAATRQNEQLKAALAETQVRLSLREGDLAGLSRQLAALTAAAGSPTAATAGLKTEIDQLQQELDQARAVAAAQAQVAATSPAPSVAAPANPLPAPAPELAQLHQDLDQARAAAAAAQIAQADLQSQLQQAGKQLADAQAQLAAVRSAPPAPAPSAELAQLHQELDPAPAAAAAAQIAQADLQNQLQQAGKQLADAQTQLAAARTGPDEAKALAAERDGLKEHLASQQAQMDRLIAELAAVPPKPEPADAAAPPAPPAPTTARDQQLADANEKLTEVLRAFTLQQTELDRVKTMLADTDAARVTATDQLAAASKTTDDRAAALTGVQQDLAAQRATTATIAGELANVREQLRLAQATAEAATAENQDLKTRLALAGGPMATSPNGVTLPSPDRPAMPLVIAPVAEPAPPVSESPAVAVAEPRVHVVAAGDTLGGLAKKYYGNAARWNTILEANRALLKNPNVLPLGARLQIP